MSATPSALLPNAVLAVNEWAKTRTAITGLVGNRVAPWLTGTFPAIRLTDVGGSDHGPEEVRKRIQVECWAEDYDTADLIARTFESQLPTFRGTYGAGVCAGAAVEAGPFSSPDETSQRYRVQLDIVAWLYPAAV